MAHSMGLLQLAGMLCILAASLVACHTIWLRGFEGWESWNARTGLDDDQATLERYERLRDRPHE